MDPCGLFMSGIHVSTKTIEAMFGIAVVVVMCLELFRRPLDSWHGEFLQSAGKYKKLLRECAPEAAGALCCVVLVAMLRFRGDTISGTLDAHSLEAWESIKAQWPVLMTADTLLAIQAMLRLVVVLSAVLRSGARINSPLLEECSAKKKMDIISGQSRRCRLWFGGAVARCFVLKQSQAYWLEGPVGGLLPAALDASLVPLLFLLGHSAMRRSGTAILLVSGLVAVFSHRNNLNLAEETEANILFTAVHCFEFLSALLYAGRTMLLGGDGQPSVTFMHLVMVIQQSLATYFWLQAFDADMNVNGSGLGICAIQISCLGQLCAYLAAASLHAATLALQDVPVHTSV
ncbi:unnamed protein product [Durusdinium trenchii]|uniref:Uncharacterized protein n=2 Tax=Durusdinium trenchii TaxID=1381693 RepID=A0ABP0RZL1_9DINO